MNMDRSVSTRASMAASSRHMQKLARRQVSGTRGRAGTLSARPASSPRRPPRRRPRALAARRSEPRPVARRGRLMSGRTVDDERVTALS